MSRKITLLASLMGLCVTVHARQIKSADGSKTIDAEFVRYSTSNGNVTLKVKGQGDMVVPANRFSKEDVAYFIEQQKVEEQKNAIRVDVDQKSENANAKRGDIFYKIKNSKVNFSISNSSGFEFKDLTVNHWVVVEREHSGSKSIEVIQGSKALSKLPASGNVTSEGPVVGLAQGAVSQCKTGCPKVAARAAAIGRDRVIGSKIQILDAAGKEVLSYRTSNSIDAHLAAAKKPSK